MDWQQIAMLVAGAIVMLLTTGKLDWKALVAKLLGGLTPAKAEASADEDPTKRRMLMALDLRKACEGACPEAMKLIEQLIPHLLPGHVEER